MTYTQAAALIEQSRHKGRAAVLFGCPGGFKRYVWLSHGGDAIEVRLFDTVIARIFADDSIMLRNGGHDTATTRLAHRYLLEGRGIGLWADRAGRLVFHSHRDDEPDAPYRNGVLVTEDGRIM